MIRQFFLAGPLLMALAAPMLAQDCDRAATQADLTECAGAHFRTADDALNETYTELTMRMDAAARGRLVVAQRAWIAFRDAECDYSTGGPTGAGTIYPILQLQCLTALTAARTDALADYVICPGGDLSCIQP